MAQDRPVPFARKMREKWGGGLTEPVGVGPNFNAMPAETEPLGEHLWRHATTPLGFDLPMAGRECHQ